MTDRIDCIIAGAGVLGLAIGRRLAKAGFDVAVLETEAHIGMHTSSRNSEVIHAGLYYPTDSLKATLCTAGKLALYDYCEAKGIPHNRIGKLVVATSPAEESTLRAIGQQAAANGVDDLRWLDRDEVRAIEPEVRASAALLSPSTGVLDTHAYLLALQADLESAGGTVVLRSRVSRVDAVDGGFDVYADGESVGESRCFVNAAGLEAFELAAVIEGVDAIQPAGRFFARGHYFAYAGRSPFSHLIYPVPIDGGLGIHATHDMSGALKFGPDVEWIDAIDYGFPTGLEAKFLAAIERYFPGVEPDRLSPSYTGIRPKLAGPGEPPADFAILGPTSHGVPGLVHLFGMESPALTASLAISDYVHRMLTA